MEPTSTPPETTARERTARERERGPRPSFTQALVSNQGMVAWFRSRLEGPRLAFLRRRSGRRWLALLHLLNVVAVVGWAVIAPTWIWAWLLYPVVMVVFFLLTGLLHAVTFGMIALRWRDLDERQRLVQGWAYRLAHRISAALVVAAFIAVMGVFGVQQTLVVDRVATLFVVAGFLVAVIWLPAYVLAFSRHVDDLDG